MKFIRFILNIIRVASYYVRAGQYVAFFWKAMDGVPQIWAALTLREKDSASPDVIQGRLSQCSSCPVFDGTLRTCGNPWDRKKDWDVGSGQEPMGCFCQMEYKAQMKTATCWLNEQTDYAHGWKRSDGKGTGSA